MRLEAFRRTSYINNASFTFRDLASAGKSALVIVKSLNPDHIVVSDMPNAKPLLFENDRYNPIGGTFSDVTKRTDCAMSKM